MTTVQSLTAFIYALTDLHLGHISDNQALEENKEKGLIANGAAQDMSHASNLKVLEILGARLGRDELLDDELQETNCNMENNSLTSEVDDV